MSRMRVGVGLLLVAGFAAGVLGLRQQVDELSPAPLPSVTVSADSDVAIVGPTTMPAAPTPSASVASAQPAPAVDTLTIPAITDGTWTLTRRAVADGELVLPGDVHEATLWAGSSASSLLVSSHVRNEGRWGPMRQLHTLQAGNVAVTKVEGVERRWKLVQLYSVPKAELSADVWSTNQERLIVVTCGGTVVGKHYTDNVVAEFIRVGK